MNIGEILKDAVRMNASDVHITTTLPPIVRVQGILEPYNNNVLSSEDTCEIIGQVLNDIQLKKLYENGEVDLPYYISGTGRFRVNAFKQRGSLSMAIRILNPKIPTLDELKFPDSMKELAGRKRGLILVTGPTGSGKSTTLAAMVDYINSNRNCHILTLEDPIEYLHTNKKSMINQREIGTDSQSFANALRAALREDPDVILVGEMRDTETIGIAVTAAETGHLVLSTLHTTGAIQTIDRIIDVFPSGQQQQIRMQMASVLQGTISQQLLPMSDGKGRVAALEIMVTTTAVSNMIREGRTHQIGSTLQTSLKNGMRSMDYSLAELVLRGDLEREMALAFAYDPDMVVRFLRQPVEIYDRLI